MNYFYRQGLSLSGFRAVVSSAALADWWWINHSVAREQPPASELVNFPLHAHLVAESSALWPSLYCAVAEACARREPIAGQVWSQPFQALAKTSQEAVLLAATPVLLLQVNRYGHQQVAIQGWASNLGLSPILSLSLENYFQHLCQTLTGQVNLLAVSPTKTVTLSEPSPHLQDVLRPLQTLVQSVQGQFLLALELAQSLGYSGPAISLLGLLACLHTGPPGLPLKLYCSAQISPTLVERWQNHTIAQLEHLAEELYRHWAGVGPAAVPGPQTAYNG